MSNTDTQTTTNAPTYVAYQVRNGSQKGHWIRVGAAWPTKNGTGFNLQLDAVPLDGRITLLPAAEKSE